MSPEDESCQRDIEGRCQCQHQLLHVCLLTGSRTLEAATIARDTLVCTWFAADSKANRDVYVSVLREEKRGSRRYGGTGRCGYLVQ